MSDQDPQQSSSNTAEGGVAENQQTTPLANTCIACKRSIGSGPYYRVGPQTVCPQCAVQVQQLAELNRFEIRAWMTGALLGAVVAVVSGILWALIVRSTGYEIGLIAVGIGYLVSKSVMHGAGGRRGPPIQALCMILSILGIMVGKVLTIMWLKPDRPFDAFDLLWFGFAIWEAWRIPRALNIPIHGPYSDSQQAETGLQFDTMQPLRSASQSTAAPPPPPPSEGPRS